MNCEKLKVDIGCGKNKRQGFIGIDIDPNSDADIICSALDLLLEDSSVDEINCSHLVEHFTPKQAQVFFNEIYRVLKKNGTANLKIDKDWTNKKLLRKDFEHKYRYNSQEIEKMTQKFFYKKVEDKVYFLRWNKPRRKIFVRLIK